MRMISPPQISIFTGSYNDTMRLYNDIYTLIRFPTFELTYKKKFYWEIEPHWEDGGTKEDFVYKNEGFDKLGYLRLYESDSYLFVHFITKSKKEKIPYVAVLFLLARFAVFLKTQIEGMPHEFNITLP